MRPEITLLALLFASAGSAGDADIEVGGHTKFNLTSNTFPADSAIRDLIGANTVDGLAELRLNVEWRDGNWSAEAGWQLAALAGDSIDLSGLLPPDVGVFYSRLPSDDRRLFDLTDVIDRSGDVALLHRLDRLWIGYATEKAVVRVGRQSLSWGNGLFYAPMDLINPFDPSAIDTEYKAGDDMLYAQYLRDSGDDVQGAVVFRREPVSGDVASGEATAALKYHGFAGDLEYDFLLAKNYDDPVVGIGVSRAIGGAIWSADVVLTDTDLDRYTQVVTNLTYSWEMGGKNMSGVIEYHYNGFGQSGARYSPLEIANNPDLLLRLLRGQSFTLGQHYLAGSVTIEMTPLWTFTPVLLANARDPSALLQLTSNYSLADDMTLLGSINLPLGPDGSEFGGVETGLPDRFLSNGPGAFLQFAWYF